MKRLDVCRLATGERNSDVVIIGTGVAGLRAALGLAPRRVTVLTKSAFAAGGSSPWAQGGVAAAMGSDDSPRIHALDTLAAGAGLSTASTVATLTEEGPEQIRQLIDLGADFDRDADGRVSLGREGAHQRRRVLHADGDATGAEVVRSLAAAVRQQADCAIFEHAEATDLVLADDGSYPGRVIGVLADHGSGRRIFHRAGAVILATGGFGQVYARTTNPHENTGDGLVMAARAGARLADLEMVQFHPTALDVAADPLPLVTEALRGEGAVLIDQAGHRFMVEVHEMAELAPRDIVSRAIWRLQEGGGQAFLDAREAVGAAFPERFPTVFEACQRHGIDPRTQPIPVTPAAHYTMAGVATDDFGRCSLDGLWACGEVTSTGIHGANRLASNSLLEALVFGARVASDIASGASEYQGPGVVKRDIEGMTEVAETAQVRRHLRHHLRDRVRELMWRSVGLVRDRQGLEDALGTLRALATDGSVAAVGETRNLLTIGILVSAAALVREESRGGHYRTDFPRPDIVWQRRLLWTYKPTRHRQSPLEAVLQQYELAREIA